MALEEYGKLKWKKIVLIFPYRLSKCRIKGIHKKTDAVCTGAYWNVRLSNQRKSYIYKLIMYKWTKKKRKYKNKSTNSF